MCVLSSCHFGLKTCGRVRLALHFSYSPLQAGLWVGRLPAPVWRARADDGFRRRLWASGGAMPPKLLAPADVGFQADGLDRVHDCCARELDKDGNVFASQILMEI